MFKKRNTFLRLYAQLKKVIFIYKICDQNVCGDQCCDKQKKDLGCRLAPVSLVLGVRETLACQSDCLRRGAGRLGAVSCCC